MSRNMTILVGTVGQGVMRSEDSGDSWRRAVGRGILPISTSSMNIDDRWPDGGLNSLWGDSAARLETTVLRTVVALTDIERQVS